MKMEVSIKIITINYTPLTYLSRAVLSSSKVISAGAKIRCRYLTGEECQIQYDKLMRCRNVAAAGKYAANFNTPQKRAMSVESLIFIDQNQE